MNVLIVTNRVDHDNFKLDSENFYFLPNARTIFVKLKIPNSILKLKWNLPHLAFMLALTKRKKCRSSLESFFSCNILSSSLLMEWKIRKKKSFQLDSRLQFYPCSTWLKQILPIVWQFLTYLLFCLSTYE